VRRYDVPLYQEEDAISILLFLSFRHGYIRARRTGVGKDKKHRLGAFPGTAQLVQALIRNQFLLNAFNKVFTKPPKNLGSLIV
jgi:hypothetical protein